MTGMRDDRLDDLLDAWRVEPASMQLRDAVLAGAPKPRAPGFRLPGFASARFWLAGAGLAAGLAGVSCGVAFSTVAVREAQDEALVAAAAGESPAAILPAVESVRAL